METFDRRAPANRWIWPFASPACALVMLPSGTQGRWRPSTTCTVHSILPVFLLLRFNSVAIVTPLLPRLPPHVDRQPQGFAQSVESFHRQPPLAVHEPG